MLLAELLEAYVASHAMPIAESTISYFYTPAIRDLAKYLGREPTVADLTEKTFNAWIGHKLQRGVCSDTINCRKRAIMAIWRYHAAKSRRFPNTGLLRKIPKKPRIITAWTRDEIEQLFSSLANSSDRVLPTGVSRRDYFLSLMNVAYETGLRLGDLLCLKYLDIHVRPDGYGIVTVVQNKTGTPKSSSISPQTLQLIDKLMEQQPHSQLIWPMWCRREGFFRQVREIVASAGIRKGTFRWLRRSGATHVEKQNPGCGWRYAGHTDQRVTFAHYLDKSQLHEATLTPPPINRIANQ